MKQRLMELYFRDGAISPTPNVLVQRRRLWARCRRCPPERLATDEDVELISGQPRKLRQGYLRRADFVFPQKVRGIRRAAGRANLRAIRQVSGEINAQAASRAGKKS